MWCNDIPYVFLHLHSCGLKENFLFSSRFKFAPLTLFAAKRLKFNMPPENGYSVAILYYLWIYFFFKLNTWSITSLNIITLLLFLPSKKNRKKRFISDFYSGVTPQSFYSKHCCSLNLNQSNFDWLN